MEIQSAIAILCLCVSFIHAANVKPLPTIALITTCVENGVTYNVGDSYSPNPCQHCTCGDGGHSFCYVMDCAAPPCTNPVHKPGQCCPVCEHGSNCLAPDGTIIQSGQTVTLASGAVCSCPKVSTGIWFGHHSPDALCAIP